MVRMMLAAGAALTALAAAVPASAGPTSDALTRCLVAKTTSADKAALVQWVYAGMSASPTVRAMSAVTDQHREQTTRRAAQILERLLTVDCRAQAVAAIKADGPNALKQSFGTLGETAMMEIVQDPAVTATFAGVAAHMDIGKLATVMLEGGMGGQ